MSTKAASLKNSFFFFNAMQFGLMLQNKLHLCLLDLIRNLCGSVPTQT